MKKSGLSRKTLVAGALLLQLGALVSHSHAAPGDVDLSFDPGAGLGGQVHGAALQPDGKVLLAGAFTTVNGTTRNRIARLHPDGSLDINFDHGQGADRAVRSIALQSDGQVLIGGDFLSVDGLVRHYVARLHGDSPSPSLTIAVADGFLTISWPTTTLNIHLQERAASDWPIPSLQYRTQLLLTRAVSS